MVRFRKTRLWVYYKLTTVNGNALGKTDLVALYKVQNSDGNGKMLVGWHVSFFGFYTSLF